MRLYIDEVGNSDLRGASTDPNIQFLSLTAITVKRALHEAQFVPQIEHLKRHFPDHSQSTPVILHRREIMRKEGPFSVLRDPDLEATFNDELEATLGRLPFLVNTVQIDKKAHLEKYRVWQFEPYHYCLCCIVERYVLFLETHNLTGDVVIEPRNKKSDKKLKDSFRRIYTSGTDNISAGRIQARLLSHDIGFFAKAANVAGLQVADILAHPSARYMRFKRDNLDHPDDYGTRLAELLVRSKYSRSPRGKITGWGLKWLP